MPDRRYGGWFAAVSSPGTGRLRAVRRGCAAVLFAWFGFANPAWAAIERLIDLSPPRQVRVELQWAPFQSQRGDRDPAYHLMRADVPRIEVRLDTSRHVGRQARVLYVIPLDAGLTAPQGLRVRWKSQGALRAGEGQAGDRVVVFEGRVAGAVLEDVFDVQLEVDSRFFNGRLRFDPYFEIEAP